MMMTNGAEVYRVEETIERICLACGLKEVEVFATPTGIIASVDSGEGSRRRIYKSETSPEYKGRPGQSIRTQFFFKNVHNDRIFSEKGHG